MPIKALPFTSQLAPTAKNLPYLINSAILSRFLVSIARVTVDHPKFNPNPDASKSQKMNTFLERMFVEFIGTASYMFAMQFCMDGVAKGLENLHKISPKMTLFQPAHLMKQLHPNTPDAVKHGVQNSLEQTFGKKTNNVVYRILIANSTNLKNLKQAFASHGINPEAVMLKNGRTLLEGAERQFYQVNILSKVALLGGIFGVAFWGGWGVQTMNDKFWGPVVVPKLKAFFKLPDEPTIPKSLASAQKSPAAAPQPSSAAKTAPLATDTFDHQDVVRGGASV